MHHLFFISGYDSFVYTVILQANSKYMVFQDELGLIREKSCKWRLRFWINVFRIAFWTWKICYRLKKINENSLIRHQNWKYDLIWGYLKKLEETLQDMENLRLEEKKSTFGAFASWAKYLEHPKIFCDLWKDKALVYFLCSDRADRGNWTSSRKTGPDSFCHRFDTIAIVKNAILTLYGLVLEKSQLKSTYNKMHCFN